MMNLNINHSKNNKRYGVFESKDLIFIGSKSQANKIFKIINSKFILNNKRDLFNFCVGNSLNKKRIYIKNITKSNNGGEAYQFIKNVKS